MILVDPPNRDITVGTIEAGLTAILCACAFLAPGFGSRWFSRVEGMLSRFARRKKLAVLSVGAAVILLRLALLPLFPVPLPFVPDDFSFLLAADTFLHGRLANPTPAMWTHFETIHVTMQPTFASMYFPAQGLVLGAGKLLFGSPWVGLLLVSAAMCAALCWMLQAWLPAGWALLGGALAVLHLGVFSYWTNTYHAAGSICALGGALVLGALPRLKMTFALRHALTMAAGIALLVLCRPYEGMLLSLPVACAIGYRIWTGRTRLPLRTLMARAILPVGLIAAAIAWLGYYDDCAFGSPTTLPYTIDRAEYAVAPYYVWQSPRPEPAYRHDVLRRFYASYSSGEMEFYARIHKASGFVPETLKKAWSGLLFFAGAALLPPLIMLRRVLLDRRIRFLVACALVLAAGMAIEIYMLPHYLAAFTAVFYAIGLQAMRHLRVWGPEGRTVGVTMVRFLVVICLASAGLRVLASPLHIKQREWPPSAWNFTWYGPGHFGTERARIASQFEQLPGRQLAIVRYSPGHETLDEWVYNDANIEDSKVIWAREMSPAENLELIRHYNGRTAWLVEPDAPEPAPVPYPMGQFASVSH